MAAMLQLAGKAAQTTWNSTYEAHTFREESNDSDYMDDEQYIYIFTGGTDIDSTVLRYATARK